MVIRTLTRAAMETQSLNINFNRSSLMKFSRAFLLGSAVLAVAACKSDPVSTVVSPDASAAVRWVNAIPDTVGMDYRIVDYPSNASEPGLVFGASSGNWRIVPAG